MTERMCDDKALLISYLYGECDVSERRLVEQHLRACARCAAEVDELRGVRHTLQQWAPPDAALGFRLVRDAAGSDAPAERAPVAAAASPAVPAKTLPFRRWMPARLPVWAQAAAAVLVLAVGAGIANLDVRVGNGGVTIHTGWQKPSVAQVRVQPAPAVSAASRAELTALEQRLENRIRTLQTQSVASSPAGSSATTVTRVSTEPAAARLSAADMQQVQRLVDEMGQRQQQQFDRLMADRFVGLMHDINVQRSADFGRIQQGLVQIDRRTTSDILQMRQTQNAILHVLPVTEIK